MSKKIHDLASRARAKKITLAEVKGSTFTITSLGKLGVLVATPIINYPESGILAVHAIRTLQRYIEKDIKPRKIMNISISLDHRIIDGFTGAKFIHELKEILEEVNFHELHAKQ